MGRILKRDHVAIANQYCHDVVDGKLVAGQWIRAACQRQIDDLKNPPASVNQQNEVDGVCYFDAKSAASACRFVELLPHVKGRWTSATIRLEPWQCFVLAVIFGWMNARGLRRFRKALMVIPRKNAKTTMAAAMALYVATVDREPGAEIYAVARTRQQARVVWDLAREMIDTKYCKGLRKRFGVRTHAHHITIGSGNGVFRPLSRDAKSLEGMNPHAWIADEVHAHKDRTVFDALAQGTGARSQPLGVIISTEGEGSVGLLAEQINYAQQLLTGRHIDHTYFAAVWTIDKGDDWTEAKVWAKANPNLGVSVFVDELAQLCSQAQVSPEAQATFLSRRLNVRVGAANGYFNLLAWANLCRDEKLRMQDFRGEPCFVGVDLATKKDLAVYVKGIERDGLLHVFARFYLPIDAIRPGNPNFDFYDGWSKRKDPSGFPFLTLCDGPKINQRQIEQDIMADAEVFDVQSIGVDIWQGDRLIENLQDAGLPAIEVPQRTLRLSSPMKELETDILAGRLRHDGNPVLEWCMSNVIAKMDANDNVFPRKERFENKIDGAIALILCKDQLMRVDQSTIPSEVRSAG